MAIVTNPSQNMTYSDVFKHEYEPSIAWCHETKTANEASATTYEIGTVVGVVTATGKVKKQDASSTDGSETAFGVVSERKAIPATTDTVIRVAVRGPAIVNKSMLVFGAGTNTDPEKQAIYDALAAKNILANTSIN